MSFFSYDCDNVIQNVLARHANMYNEIYMGPHVEESVKSRIELKGERPFCIWEIADRKGELKQCFLRKTMSPQPFSN